VEPLGKSDQKISFLKKTYNLYSLSNRPTSPNDYYTRTHLVAVGGGEAPQYIYVILETNEGMVRP